MRLLLVAEHLAEQQQNVVLGGYGLDQQHVDRLRDIIADQQIDHRLLQRHGAAHESALSSELAPW